MDKTILYRKASFFYQCFPGPDPSLYPAASGTPIPVVLIHGFAEDGAIWERQTDQLKNNFRLLIPDLPGSGRSSPLTAPTSMEELADAVGAMLDEEKIETAILIGHSMGGYVALAFVEKYPCRCKGFGLFHSTAYPDSEEKKITRRKSMAFIRKHGAAEFMGQSTPNLFAESSLEQHPEWMAEITQRSGKSDPDSLIQYYQAMIDRPDRTPILAGSGLPTLFIIGTQDNTLPFEASLCQSHLPSLAFIHILENAGHMGMIEQAEQSNKILEEFLHFTILHTS
jgi:pimeloyl-ACP methyl ester carboxylesterase